MNAKSFADYCSAQGLRCVLRDVKDDGGSEYNGNVITMMFTDEGKKKPDVNVEIEFVDDCDITVWMSGFAKYEGYPEQKEVLRRVNTINAVTPFANFVLHGDQLLQVLTVIRGTAKERDLLELIFFNIHTALTVSKFVFANKGDTNKSMSDFLSDYEVKGDKM